MKFFGHFSSGKATVVGDWLTQRTVRQQFEFVLANMPDNKNAEILEIGPGRGDFAELFTNAGFRNYDILEPDETLRELCARLPLRRVYCEVMPPLPAPGDTYDLVIMCDVFEHMNDTAMALSVLKEVHRVLRPGGRFFHSVPRLQPLEDRLLQLRLFPFQPDHCPPHEPNVLQFGPSSRGHDLPLHLLHRVIGMDHRKSNKTSHHSLQRCQQRIALL